MLPLLAPLLAVLLVAAFNPGPAVAVRLLTLRSAALPLGLWLAAGGAGGALFSALATGLALRQGGRGGRSPRAGEPDTWIEQPAPFGRSAEPAPRRTAAPPPEPPWPGAGPERAPGEPPPTVSVPFRVIRRPSPGTTAVDEAAAAAVQSNPGSVVSDDWDDSSSDEDW